MAKEGRYDDALRLIKQDNPFPAVCGDICNRRCEDACTRGTIDMAVAIDEVKKFIAMQDLNAETRYIPKKVIPKAVGGFDEKIAIIGAGPAGLSCAYYLAEKGYLREDDAAIRRAEQGIRKGWGIRRIRDDLRAHGYSAEAVEEALGALDEVDTSSQCAQVIRKKYGSIPSDAAERRKMIAALLRQGYGMDEIRAAMEMVLREGC